jgi:D-arabinose 1-dehydrogenase-like Zn-dependent alcohol dehydrogenase
VFIRQIQIQGSTLGSIEEFRRLLPLVATGQLRPVIERSFAPQEVTAADSGGSSRSGSVEQRHCSSIAATADGIVLTWASL